MHLHCQSVILTSVYMKPTSELHPIKDSDLGSIDFMAQYRFCALMLVSVGPHATQAINKATRTSLSEDGTGEVGTRWC